MQSMNSHKIIFASAIVLIAAPSLTRAAEPSRQISIRFIVLTDSDGTNAAASTKQIDEQLAVLRNDAARHGINIAAGRTQFVADSALRKVSASEVTTFATRAVNDARPDEIVVYVTSLTVPDKAPATKYLLLPRDGATTGEKNDSQIPRGARNDSVVARSDSGVGQTDSEGLRDNSAAKTDRVAVPAIVIDAKEFGGQGCGPTRSAPCRAMTLAMADAITASVSTGSTHDAATQLKVDVSTRSEE